MLFFSNLSQYNLLNKNMDYKKIKLLTLSGWKWNEIDDYKKNNAELSKKATRT